MEQPEVEVDDEDSNDGSPPSSLMDAAKKWIGIGAAALSVLSAGYGSLQYQAEKKARSQESVQLLTTSQTQLRGGDFAGAWASLKGAQDEIDKEGVIVRALGGLTREQAQVHAAQEQLAMTWLRQASRSNQQGEATQVSDAVLPVLSTGADAASGSAKADLLAHIGLAYWLKTQDGAAGLHQVQFYKDAIAVDPKNPYANTFWATPMVNETSASEAGVAQAKQLFDAALSSDRAKGELREWIRAAELGSVQRFINYPAAKAFFWQIIGQLRQAGETIDSGTLQELYDQYVEGTISIAAFTDSLNKALMGLPDPAVHVALLQEMINKRQDKQQQGYLQTVLALTLEKAGKPQEALAVWRTARSGPAAEYLSRDMDAAIARLSAGSAQPAAGAPANKTTPASAPRRR